MSEIFDDLYSIEPCCELDVKAVTLEFGEFIAGIKTEYATLQDTYDFRHVGNSTESLNVERITLAEGERITGVSGMAGWMLNEITFSTSTGNSYTVMGAHGGGVPFTVDIPDNFHVIGFGGGKREYIDSLFIYIRAHPDEGCQCDDALLGNGTCNRECFTQECAMDLGDCEVHPDCHCNIEMLLNEVCDPDCNYPACWNDLGSCIYDNC